MRERKSLFIFLMGLAWKFRFSMPLLLSSTVAMLGRAWMFQIRVQTVQGIHEHEQLEIERAERAPLVDVDISYYDEDEEAQDEDEMEWESGSTDSWETLVEEVAYG